uniref:Tetraspanin n=1 Tax=Phaeomonas parva TaxID=124430 RepID=A0A7S1TZE2_9STRA|mmetsp:Transcript_24749/g.77612  ORF Transcript_24749/g.77612 Transcript_24749/m.77612 type:complete len:278 (+) Transcript_24749:155-988(+)|eukprot:CAMPEP_0118875970 /NCGR_PEP_ID=MMETSP1163-20130328/16848_1 /TAXON_ID=124430 /ORGANISM="Phaeomonas parva, Strain CCMP2877" /LENGTH=277 /DNA_ID=CAMNT_0006811537 /DNA_START=121 /DNA_END=954 /DNA_ORIENTATION=+
MGKLNDIIKVLTMTADILVGMVGVMILAIGMYAITSDFAVYLDGFFTRLLIFLLATGLVGTLLSCFGCFGVVHQEGESGRVLLGSYQLGLFYLIIVCIWATFNLYNTVESLQLVQNDDSLTYDSLEENFATEYNRIYYEATCDAGSYTAFWGFINDNCPSNMWESECAAGCSTCASTCGNYFSTTTCPNEAECVDDLDSTNLSCPYVLCRSELVDWLLERLVPLLDVMIFCTVVLSINIVFNLLLICYSKRDSQVMMLAKTGVKSYDEVLLHEKNSV